VLTQLTALELPEEEASAVRVVAHLQTPVPFEVRQDGNVVQVFITNPVAEVPPTAPMPLQQQPGIIEQTPPVVPAPRLIPAQLAASSPVTAPPGGQQPLVMKAAAAPAAPSSGEVATPTPAPVLEAQGPRYTGEKISLDFQNADINDILRLIAEVSGLNIIAGEDVKGTITTRMVDVPWDQALDVILKINGLAQEREGNIVRVAPISRFITERQESVRARRTETEAEPTVTQVVPINYASATELRDNLTKLLSNRGTIFIDVRTNTMIITDTKKNLEDVLALVDTLDRQTPQVMIEARIVEANRNFTRELGVRLRSRGTFSSTCRPR
jgi:type IV pilus assembly protein PilQ